LEPSGAGTTATFGHSSVSTFAPVASLTMTFGAREVRTSGFLLITIIISYPKPEYSPAMAPLTRLIPAELSKTSKRLFFLHPSTYQKIAPLPVAQS
jgi:hypothetical protein